MKDKLLKIIFGLIVFAALYAASTNVQATTIKENVSSYNNDVYLIGATRFDSSVVVTATRAAKAGMDQARLNLALGKDLLNAKLTTYYYDSLFEEWYELRGNNFVLLSLAESKNIQSNLNIYFVNNVEKTLDFNYSGKVDAGSITNGVTYDGTKFKVPVTQLTFKFKSNGVEQIVKTDRKIMNGQEIVDHGDFYISQNGNEKIVAELNNKYYTQEEFQKLPNKNGNIKFHNDMTVNSMILFDKPEQNVVIDLNGYTITAGNNNDIFVMIGDNSSITIKNGNLKNSAACVALRAGIHSEKANIHATIEKDVTITGYYYGVGVFGNGTVLDFNGKINITGDGAGILGSGGKKGQYTVVNMHKDAKIEATNKGFAFYLPQMGETNILGGTITATSAVGIKAGKLNISGGTINSVGETLEPTKNSNGSMPTGDVIFAEVNDKYEKNIEINITGGTLKSEKGSIILIYKSNSTDDVTVKSKYQKVVNKDNENIITYN